MQNSAFPDRCAEKDARKKMPGKRCAEKACEKRRAEKDARKKMPGKRCVEKMRRKSN